MGPSVEGVLLNKMAPCPYMVKTLKIFFSRTRKALGLNLGIQHLGGKVYQVYSNDNSRMTFLQLGQLSVLVAMVIPEECCMTSADMQ